MRASSLALHLKASGIQFEQEVRFHPKRRWRFDFLVPPNIAIEVNGGVYSRGRHSRGAGQEADYEKLNEAVLMGYRVLQFSTGQVKSGMAIETIRRAVSLYGRSSEVWAPVRSPSCSTGGSRRNNSDSAS